MLPQKIYVGNDNTITWPAEVNGTVISDATVTMSFADIWGNEVGGATDLSMTYSSEQQTYVGTIPAAAEFTPNTDYVMTILLISSEGTARWDRDCVALARDY